MKEFRKYYGKKQCIICEHPANNAYYWNNEKKPICHHCEETYEKGKRAEREKLPVNSIAIGVGAYTPAVYYLNNQFNLTPTREALCNEIGFKTAAPAYISETCMQASRELNNAIKLFLKELEVGSPEVIIDSFPVESPSTSYRLREEHAIAWIKFYHAFSNYSKVLIDYGKKEGKNYLQSLIKKESELYNQ